MNDKTNPQHVGNGEYEESSIKGLKSLDSVIKTPRH